MIGRLSASTENITLCILHQISGWKKDSLLAFDLKYKDMARKAITGDKKVLRVLSQITEDMNLQLPVELEHDSRCNSICANVWRLCLKSVFAVLKESNDTNALQNVYKDYDQWVTAVGPDSPYETRKAAYELLNETLKYIGHDEVKWE